MKEDLIHYFDFQEGEEGEISTLVQSVFMHSIGPDFPKEGIDTFLKYTGPENILHFSEKENCRIFTAKDVRKIVGVLGIRDSCHIALFFVDPSYQRRGIARILFERYLKQFRKEPKAISSITVNSSLYAIPIYSKLGFQLNGDIETRDGIIAQPMKRML